MISLICILVFGKVNSYKNFIHVESNHISINYDFNLKDELSSDFRQTIDTSIFTNITPINCSDENTVCLKWSNFEYLKIFRKDDYCKTYEFSTQRNDSLQVRFDITNVFLYGGAERVGQTWPADNAKLENVAHVTREIVGGGSFELLLQGVVESYWLVSNGMYLYVDKITPLFISQDKTESRFQLVAEKKRPYSTRAGATVLKYMLCKLENMKEAHKHAVKHVLGKPSGLPDTKMVRYPTWSTWPTYMYKGINSQQLIEYAKLIEDYQMPKSYILIDSNWAHCFGNFSEDQKTFPDMKNTVHQLKSMGFRVKLKVHPIVTEGCLSTFLEARRKGYFVKSETGSNIILSWNGTKARYVDFTKLQAANWWKDKLKTLLSETGADSFKFTGGQSNWIPSDAVLNVMGDDYPETIVKAFVDAASSFGNAVDVVTARGTQRYPIYIRIYNERQPDWEGKLGLSSFIPTLLQLNIIGYPFVVSDAVGGNEEVYIRWLQMFLFTPSIQFSLPACWEVSDQAVLITKKFLNLREKYVPKILEAMRQATEAGTPVNRPIWWTDPNDPETYQIDSEYLLGEDILVAPVIQKGAKSRDIYLPKGFWVEQHKVNPEIIKGPKWLRNYPADSDVLPFFVKFNI